MTRVFNRLSVPNIITAFDQMKMVHKDVFDMSYIYFLTHEWLVENEWAPFQEPSWPEVLYLHRESSAGTEIVIKWRLKKSRYDPLVYWEMDMDWHILGMKNQEVLIKGKKRKMVTGECEIMIKSRLMENKTYQKDSVFSRFRTLFFRRYYLKRKLDLYEDQLLKETTRFFEILKGYFHIDTYLSDQAFERFYNTASGVEKPKV